MERYRPLSGYATFAFLLGVSAAAAPPALPGVGNFHQVDAHVYRGAQPNQLGFENLARLGVRIVIDLREPGSRSRTEEQWVTASGMRYAPIPMKGVGAPNLSSVEQALAILENASAGPVFVHCQHGKDRTGTVIACYRMEHDHCSADQALAEARSFGMSRLEKGMRQFILDFRPRSPTGADASGAC